MLPPDQFASPDKEYLYNSILLPQIKAFIHGNCDDILIFLSVTYNFLTFSDPLDTADQIPVFHGILETHFFGSCHHFVGKHINRILKVSIEKFQQFCDIFLIFF